MVTIRYSKWANSDEEGASTLYRLINCSFTCANVVLSAHVHRTDNGCAMLGSDIFVKQAIG